jgi:hypothetical protein
MVRFRRSQIIRLGRLLCMLYRPAEIASEIGCHVDTVYRSYIPAGCPHARDGTGHIWINGRDFAEWARELTSKSRRPLDDGEAFCLKCNAPVEMAGNLRVSKTNRHLELITGVCPVCGTTVNRARACHND